jgi:hypothetical protein
MSGVTEGDRVRCVYAWEHGDCDNGVVTVDEVHEQEDGGVFAEGECDGCGRRVEFDYDPMEAGREVSTPVTGSEDA